MTPGLGPKTLSDIFITETRRIAEALISQGGLGLKRPDNGGAVVKLSRAQIVKRVSPGALESG